MHSSNLTHDATASDGPENALAGETSPYLLQHARNPVHWYPWGQQALDLARRENKPILLSIGYSACHWCHVMAHESFEDEATAAVMNLLFVNIKVDREERPDLDKIYQLAHQMLVQRSGGWPLTMFLSPQDQRPFFGGTYFPSEARHGMPAFKDLLRRVAEFYATRSDDLNKQGAALQKAFNEMLPPAAAADIELTTAPLATARQMLAEEFDADYGGFGSAPKFPHPTNLTLLLRTWRGSANAETPDLHALYMATLTLTRMAEGGLYDQLGGGFCRYSVDRFWMIPHFEKMLYDNAQLLDVYAQAAVATADPLFKRVAHETADWVIRDMRAAMGGFWSTLDADSEGHEGRFYVWTADEFAALLSPEELQALALRFGLDGSPNFEGSWHLHAHRSLDAIATELQLPVTEVTARLDRARSRLLGVRNARVWPGRDEKILTSWNGLAVGALAVAAGALHREDLTDAAQAAADFLHRDLWRDGRLLAVHKDGRSRFAAYLDDYAFLLDGLLKLLQVRWRSDHLHFAIELAEAMLAHFADHHGGFYFTADDHEALLHRSKTFADEAIPAGNAIAAQALTRLGLLLGDTRYLEAAERTLRAAWPLLERYPHAHAALLVALDEHLDPPEILVIRGPEAETFKWRDALAALYSPRRYVFAIPESARDLPAALAEKQAMDGTVAYVCKGMTCSAPLRSVEALVKVTG